MFRFALDILRKYNGEESFLESRPTLGSLTLEKATLFYNGMDEAVAKTDNPVQLYFLSEIKKKCEEIRDLYLMKTENQVYHLLKRLNMMRAIKEELIQKTCHPSRVQWWMDEEEKQEVFAM
jgi:hypothetical protein